MNRSARAAGRAAAVLALVGLAACGGAPLFRHVEQRPVGGLATASDFAPPPLAPGPVRNLVLMIGDGMGATEIAAARLRAFGIEGRFVLERLPATAFVDTRPEGDLVARSESAATSLATGVRGRVDRLSLDPDGRPIPTLLEAAAAAGWITGLVTTSEIVDATPAAFYAHAAKRHDEARIGRQLVAAPVDLAFGGGLAELEADGALDAARQRGVAVLGDPAALATADHLPLWAIFPGHTLGETPAHPTVDEMAAKAIELLSREAARRGTGFFLLVEEEGVDTAGHANDLDRMAGAMTRFDRAVEAVTRFAASDGATLVVVTGDHGTGGPAVDQRSTTSSMRLVWATDKHTGEPVPLFAYGPPDALAPFAGTIDQPELGRRLRAALPLALPPGGDSR